jgi:hypothetical protein
MVCFTPLVEKSSSDMAGVKVVVVYSSVTIKAVKSDYN